MEHQSLCSATGIPHSTQIRTRWAGSAVFDEKRRFRNDIQILQVRGLTLSYEDRGSRVTRPPVRANVPRHPLDSPQPKKVGR